MTKRLARFARRNRHGPNRPYINQVHPWNSCPQLKILSRKAEVLAVNNKMEAFLCDEVVVEVSTSPAEDHVTAGPGDNYSTRRMGTHSDVPPASPGQHEVTSSEAMIVGTPAHASEAEDTLSGEETETSESEDEDRGDCEPASSPMRDRAEDAALPEGAHMPAAELPFGYGAVSSRASKPANGLSVPPTPRPPIAPEPPTDRDQAITRHVPATEPHRFRRLGLLADQDLPSVGHGPERVDMYAHEVRDHDQAYPYARRYSRPAPIPESRAIYECLGLAPRGYLRIGVDGSEEFAFHPTVLSALMNADWRLEAQLNHALITPMYPMVVPNLDINTTLHNYTDARFSVAPAFMPVAPAAAFASRQKWLPVQRGILMTMEELVRGAIHCQSGILHAVEEVQARSNLPALAPDLMYALETMLVQQTAVLVELIHHLTYAHRHAYVRDSPSWFRNGVLGQPLFGQRQLFTIPEAAYQAEGH